MIYAVKSVENSEVNKIYADWVSCKDLVWGKSAVYKSFPDNEYEAANKFLNSASVAINEFGHGYIPSDLKADIVYGRYKFDRCPEQENGFSVRVYEGKNKERVTCRGFMLPDNDRVLYAFSGKYIKDKKYGYQFEVESFDECVADTKDGIVAYLSSGVIKGIGSQKAEAIYEKFGDQTLEVIEKDPDKLLSIKGISKKKLEKIKSSYIENKGARQIVSFLLKYGISPKLSTKLYKVFGSSALEKVKENPYILCQVRGLTFLDADRVAKDLKFDMNSFARTEACMMYVLKKNEYDGEIRGSTAMELQHFGNEVYSIIGSDVSKNTINEETCSLIKAHKLRVRRMEGKQYIFSQHAFQREYDIAENIIRIRDEAKKTSIDEVIVLKHLKALEIHYGITLDDIQKTAVVEALLNNIVVITGSPGTGKTIDTRFINECYKSLFPKNGRIFLAPTGRAARKITEATGEEAYTVHSYLHIYDEDPMPEDKIEISDSLVLIDESSMIDVNVAHALFDAIGNGCTVVIVGDIDQLPSVGPGAVLRDIIESDVIPVIRLQKIYRQDEDAEICINAKKIKEGNTDIREGKDFHFIECSRMEDIKNAMAVQYVKDVDKYGLGNVFCLCPYIEHVAGVNDMNKCLQDLINPLKENEKHVLAGSLDFRIGDIVMHQKRNTELASNGDLGVITDIIWDDEEYAIIVSMNGRELSYDKDNIQYLTLAYAMSIHKSQGSEAKAVVACYSSYHVGMIYMNIPYVAVSRGKKNVSIFGEKATLKEAITNGCGARRITLLGYELAYLGGKFVAA